MLCPNCGNADLITTAKFDFCPGCGSSFPRAQNIPSEIEREVSPQTLLQQSGASARGNSDHGAVDKTQIQGTSHQSNVLTTTKEQQGPSTGQQLGPIQQPSKDYCTVTVRHDETSKEERAGSSKGDQPPECASSTLADHSHGEGFGSKEVGATITISGSEERAGPTDREQRAECTSSTSPHHVREKDVLLKRTDETNTISGSDRLPEGRFGLLRRDQRPECTPSISSDDGNEKAVNSQGPTVTYSSRQTAGGHMVSAGEEPSITPPLEGQRGAGESTAPASSANDITADGNTAETLRGPAVLGLRDTDREVQDPSSEKSSNDSQTMPEDVKEQEGKDSVTEEKNVIDRGQDSSTADAVTSRTSIKLQEKEPKTEHLVGSGAQMESTGSKTYAQILNKESGRPVTRQAPSTGNRKLPTPPSSGRKAESVSHHPLNKSGNDHITKETTEAEGGTRYMKSDTQQQEFVGSEKNKKNQKKEGKGKGNAKQTPSTLQPHPALHEVKPEDGVTVVFHVLLASNFKMMEENFFIRAHGADLGDFQENCVDMSAVEINQSDDLDKLILFRGRKTLSLERARWGTAYKYLVVKKGKVHYEELPEFPSKFGGIVHRSLSIPEKYREPGATWNQFDGVAYVYGDKTVFSKVWEYFSRDKTAENRTKALLCFIPKWKGFLVNESTDQMDATEALSKLYNVEKCLSKVGIEEWGNHRQCQPPKFDARKALLDLLRPKMEKNIAILADGKVGSSAHVSAVVSSLAMVILVKRYSIELEREEVKSLLSCLSLEVDPAEKKCSGYEAVLAEFSPGLREFAAGAIGRLCNQLMQHAWTFNPEWLLAVPLLHFLRGDSKPFEEPDVGGSPKDRAWWGAEKLNVEDFQRNSNKQM